MAAMNEHSNCDELHARLLKGEAVVFPTDTLPALATRPEAAERLWEIKERPRSKPIVLMGAYGEELLRCLNVPIHPAWRAMAERYWPGPLTLVLPAQGALAERLNPGGKTLGLRQPACQQAIELLQCSGTLATTSVNRSGEAACLNAAEVAERFPQIAHFRPIPWPEPSGLGSTVLAWDCAGAWHVLRQGSLQPLTNEGAIRP